MCKRRKSGRVPGGEEAHSAYQDKDNRKMLAKALVESKFNEDSPDRARVSVHTHVYRENRSSMCFLPLSESLQLQGAENQNQGEGEGPHGSGWVVHRAGHEG